MAIAHFPAGLASWISVACGVAIILAYMRGIDEPRPWIEWIERRFAYSVRMRFIGGVQFALALLGWWLVRFEMSTVGRLTQFALIIVGFSGLAMLAAQNPARHLAIALAEQNDWVIRTVAIAVTLLGLALVVAPFVL